MKTIELKTTTEKITINGEESNFDISTSELIRVACNNPVAGGYTISDMMNRIKILDILNNAESENKEILQLEDADYNLLNSYIKNCKWGMISRTIVDFCNKFND